MDHHFFQHSIHPYRHKLFRFALTITRQRELAEDVVQEVFEKIWKSGNDRSGLIQNWEAWCMTLTRNLSLDKIKSPRYKSAAPLESNLDPPDKTLNPHQTIESADTLSIIKKAIAELPTAHRMAIHLRDVEGMTYEEIAQTLDITLEQVKINLHRGRKAVRQKLIESGIL